MTDDAWVRVEQLADVARAELAESLADGSSADTPLSAAASDALAGLRRSLVDAGVTQTRADRAVTVFMFFPSRPLHDCLAEADGLTWRGDDQPPNS